MQLDRKSLNATDVRPSDQLINDLGSDVVYGLDKATALIRLQVEGPNELTKRSQIDVGALIIGQLRSSVVILLLVACIISCLLHEWIQSFGIAIAILINAAIGVLTDWRSQVSLRALDKMTAPSVRVRRNGTEEMIPSEQLVRGDIVVLQPGDRAPADIRLIEDAALSVDEALLTGESVAAPKSASAESADQQMVFLGTTVVGGRATGITVATGTFTRLGRMGQSIAGVARRATPLEEELEKLGAQLTVMTIIVCIGIAVAGILRHIEPLLMLQVGIALAVAAIPEGLPVTSTLALASGVRQMLDRHALVRRLHAVETLGCVNSVCVDKTGTLTANKLQATDVATADCACTIEGEGYRPFGAITGSSGESESDLKQTLEPMFRAAVLCNDAHLEIHDQFDWHIHGDPTEGALLVAGKKLGVDESSLRNVYPRVAELPFDLQRRRMSTVHAAPGGRVLLCCKGAPESVIPLCSRVLDAKAERPLDDTTRQLLNARNMLMASQGLRVLAIAQREFVRSPICVDEQTDEQDLTFLGLVGMIDPLKPGVSEAIDVCKKAGIKVYMVTGDQPATAHAIAASLGITADGGVLTGSELSSLPASSLLNKLQDTTVFARVTPEMKLNIVKMLQQTGEVVAMTGDGVNDAPALAQSDIGVAMGLEGASLARDCAALVITDDNFSTITSAIAQGRSIFDKIHCAVAYLLTASVASVLAVAGGLFLHSGMMLSPLQLLWLNLMMHVFPSLGLVAQDSSADYMSRPPRGRQQRLLDKRGWLGISINALIISLATLLATVWNSIRWQGTNSQTFAMTVLALSIVAQSWVFWLSANDRFPANRQGFVHAFLPMLVLSACSVLMLVLATTVPVLEEVLSTSMLNPMQITVAIVSAALTFVLGCGVNYFLSLRDVQRNQSFGG